ncbi:hypothetical protein CYMTET_25229 [Cymbomonas tetramitiformis]|uniref:Reverse transcriptase domain-containing protein n=1 Tax=Cymbomonas tetramitiformis TaxID=36881 RepID=A0AAE0FU74_9CHLO|nr:hypothetical protein CYMTET_25229 [Cymbomonas tetramitiformis]
MLETGLKLFNTIIANRLKTILNTHPILFPIQDAFLPNKNIDDSLQILNEVISDANRYDKDLHVVYLDLKQAFDRAEFWMSDLALRKLGFPPQIISIISDITNDASRMVLTEEGLTDEWSLECGVPQGEVLSPLRFVAVMDILAIWLAKRANGANPSGTTYGYELHSERHRPDKPGNDVTLPSQNLLEKDTPLNIFARFFCDDIMLVGKTKNEVQDMLGIVNEFMSFIGIPINVKKYKYSYRKRIKSQGKMVKRYDLSDDLLISGGHLEPDINDLSPSIDAKLIPPESPEFLDFSSSEEVNR